jgi:hypothetical protein
MKRVLLLSLVFVAFAHGEPGAPRVRVETDVRDQGFAEKLASAIEREIPLLEKHLPGLSLGSDERLVFHVCSRPADYLAACRDRGCPEMADRTGFTSGSESWLLLQPRAEAGYLEAVNGLPELTALLACHEAVHQWLRRTSGMPIGWLPAWYGEGMAEHVSGLALGARSLHVQEQPQLALEAREAKRLPSVESLVHADLATFEDKPLLYSLAASFYALLARDEAKLQELHRRIRALGRPRGEDPGGELMKGCAAALEKVYGSLEALDEAWRESLEQTKVEWFEDGRSAERVGDTLVTAGLEDRGLAMLLSGARPDRERLSVSCELEILDLGNETREADFFLGYGTRTDRRFLRLALGHGESGHFADLQAFADGSWQPRLRRSRALEGGTFPCGEWLKVGVAGDGKRVQLRVKDREVFDVEVPAGFDVLKGRWGIGCRDDVVKWRKLEGP